MDNQKIESLFGKIVRVSASGDGDIYTTRRIKTEDFDIIHHCYYDNFHLYCVDNVRCFNKESQCPVCFELPANEAGLKAALEFLKTEEGVNASDRLEWEKFPIEFANINRTKFYQYF